MQTVHNHCAVFTSLHDVVLDGSEQKICKAKFIVLQALQKCVPHDFELMGQRKGFVRYTSAPLQELVKQHAEALQDKETALTGILQVMRCLSGMHSMCVHWCRMRHLLSAASQNTCDTLLPTFIRTHHPNAASQAVELVPCYNLNP